MTQVEVEHQHPFTTIVFGLSNMEHCATTEEINLQIKLSEERMITYVDKSHSTLAGTLSNLMGDHGDKLVQILEQVTKTNGRVTELETWRAVHISESAGTRKSIETVQTTLSRLNWLLITAVVVAVLNLIIKS